MAEFSRLLAGFTTPECEQLFALWLQDRLPPDATTETDLRQLLHAHRELVPDRGTLAWLAATAEPQPQNVPGVSTTASPQTRAYELWALHPDPRAADPLVQVGPLFVPTAWPETQQRAALERFWGETPLALYPMERRTSEFTEVRANGRLFLDLAAYRAALCALRFPYVDELVIPPAWEWQPAAPVSNYAVREVFRCRVCRRRAWRPQAVPTAYCGGEACATLGPAAAQAPHPHRETLLLLRRLLLAHPAPRLPPVAAIDTRWEAQLECLLLALLPRATEPEQRPRRLAPDRLREWLQALQRVPRHTGPEFDALCTRAFRRLFESLPPLRVQDFAPAADRELHAERLARLFAVWTELDRNRADRAAILCGRPLQCQAEWKALHPEALVRYAQHTTWANVTHHTAREHWDQVLDQLTEQLLEVTARCPTWRTWPGLLPLVDWLELLQSLPATPVPPPDEPEWPPALLVLEDGPCFAPDPATAFLHQTTPLYLCDLALPPEGGWVSGHYDALPPALDSIQREKLLDQIETHLVPRPWARRVPLTDPPWSTPAQPHLVFPDETRETPLDWEARTHLVAATQAWGQRLGARDSNWLVSRYPSTLPPRDTPPEIIVLRLLFLEGAAAQRSLAEPGWAPAFRARLWHEEDARRLQSEIASVNNPRLDAQGAQWRTRWAQRAARDLAARLPEPPAATWAPLAVVRYRLPPRPLSSASNFQEWRQQLEGFLAGWVERLAQDEVDQLQRWEPREACSPDLDSAWRAVRRTMPLDPLRLRAQLDPRRFQTWTQHERLALSPFTRSALDHFVDTASSPFARPPRHVLYEGRPLNLTWFPAELVHPSDPQLLQTLTAWLRDAAPSSAPWTPFVPVPRPTVRDEILARRAWLPFTALPPLPDSPPEQHTLFLLAPLPGLPAEVTAEPTPATRPWLHTGHFAAGALAQRASRLLEGVSCSSRLEPRPSATLVSSPLPPVRLQPDPALARDLQLLRLLVARAAPFTAKDFHALPWQPVHLAPPSEPLPTPHPFLSPALPFAELWARLQALLSRVHHLPVAAPPVRAPPTARTTTTTRLKTWRSAFNSGMHW